jgi:hypothetical protein
MEYNPSLEPGEDYPFYRIDFEKDLTGQPGTVIRHEPLAGHAVPSMASRAYRVIYQSTSGIGDQKGRPMPVSGIIAFPPDGASDEPWPVLSWAHGTVGSADKCAPSMDEYLDVRAKGSPLHLLRAINMAPHALLNAFLEAGWAVAMTDYEGLGCYGNHPYLLGDSEGRGILDIVPVVRQVAESEGIDHPIADDYAIVGHSQGGQAALFAASMAGPGEGSYATPGRLVGVAALAPASNLKGREVVSNDPAERGLLLAYKNLGPVGDLGGFYVLFTNGVIGGDPGLKAPDLLGQIFQTDALTKYLEDYDTKARVELSLDAFWMTRPPLAANRPNGIFQEQRTLSGMIPAWVRYWKQVDDFNPEVKIGVPIRISQARGDERVIPEKTEKLLTQLRAIPEQKPITEEFRAGDLEDPDPHGLGEHFGLLVDPTEIARLVKWVSDRRAEAA